MSPTTDEREKMECRMVYTERKIYRVYMRYEREMEGEYKIKLLK